MTPLPHSGAVLGIDVGYSATRASSAACCLSWTRSAAILRIARFRATETDRKAAILKVVQNQKLLAATFDGPLASGFPIINQYREAERILTRAYGRRIGKPGASNVPTGRALNAAANACAQTVLELCDLAPATHAERVHEKAIGEAFPSAFLGLMLENPEAHPVQRATRSDTYYAHLAATGTLAALLAYLLPDRAAPDFSAVTNHDDRAAVVCALTALALASNAHTSAGDRLGYILLPPTAFIAAWAR